MANTLKKPNGPILSCEYVYDTDGVTPLELTFKFQGGDTFTMSPLTLPEHIQREALFFGLKQKCCDATAISRNAEDGSSATVEDKIGAFEEVFWRLHGQDENGNPIEATWNKVRGEGNPSGGLLLQALCKFYTNKTRKELKDWLATKTKTEQAQLREVPRIKAILEEIKKQTKSPKPLDESSLFAGLDDAPM